MLSVAKKHLHAELSVVMLNVVMPSVVAPDAKVDDVDTSWVKFPPASLTMSPKTKMGHKRFSGMCGWKTKRKTSLPPKSIIFGQSWRPTSTWVYITHSYNRQLAQTNTENRNFLLIWNVQVWCLTCHSIATAIRLLLINHNLCGIQTPKKKQ